MICRHGAGLSRGGLSWWAVALGLALGLSLMASQVSCHFEIDESKAVVSNVSGLIPLYIGVLLSLSSNGNKWAEEFANHSLIAMNLAVSDLNNRTDILPDHAIHLIFKDTQVRVATVIFIDYLNLRRY